MRNAKCEILEAISWKRLRCLLLLVVLALGLGQASAGEELSARLEAYASGFQRPEGLFHAGDGSGRLFVLELAGRIRIIRDDLVLPAPFLDPGSGVDGMGGLVGLAFHPGFAGNGRFFVFYTREEGGKVTSVLSEFESAFGP